MPLPRGKGINLKFRIRMQLRGDRVGKSCSTSSERSDCSIIGGRGGKYFIKREHIRRPQNYCREHM
jgi:hypothetical protein